MTSTNFTVGMPTNGRPSSRVLAPPGGKSSIVFCDPGMEDTLEIGRQNRKKQQNSALMSEIFGTANTVTNNSPTRQKMHQTSSALMNEIFGTADPTVRYGPKSQAPSEHGDTSTDTSEEKEKLGEEELTDDTKSVLDEDADTVSHKDDDAISIKSSMSHKSLKSIKSAKSMRTTADEPITEEVKAQQTEPEEVPQQRRRVPPGGYSSGLW